MHARLTSPPYGAQLPWPPSNLSVGRHYPGRGACFSTVRSGPSILCIPLSGVEFARREVHKPWRLLPLSPLAGPLSRFPPPVAAAVCAPKDRPTRGRADGHCRNTSSHVIAHGCGASRIWASRITSGRLRGVGDDLVGGRGRGYAGASEGWGADKVRIVESRVGGRLGRSATYCWVRFLPRGVRSGFSSVRQPADVSVALAAGVPSVGSLRSAGCSRTNSSLFLQIALFVTRTWFYAKFSFVLSRAGRRSRMAPQPG